MRQLLLASVSVMAFASAAANADTQSTKIDFQSLINTAMTNVKMAEELPTNDAHIIVKKQARAILDEQVQIKLHKNLLVMAEKQERVRAEAEAE